jgi:hypothetical protein
MKITATDATNSQPDTPAAPPARPACSPRASLLGALDLLKSAQALAAGAAGEPETGDAA